MINEYVSFESRLSFIEIHESDMQKMFLILTPRKRGHLQIFLQKYLKILVLFVTPSLQDTWKYEIICQTVAEDARLKLLVSSLHYCQGCHKDLL